MLSILTDTEKAVVQTLTMKMNVKPALQYLEDVGFKMSRATYYRHKSKVEALKFQRLKFIAEHFQEQHLEKIDRLELIENLMWENYNMEANPSKKVKILESIVNAQPYLSSYYESSTIALEVSAKFNHKSIKGNKISGLREDIVTNPSPYVNIDTVMPEDRNRILPIVMCHCLDENHKNHYACYRCLKAFCLLEDSEDDDRNNGVVRCPQCKIIVYNTESEAWR